MDEDPITPLTELLDEVRDIDGFPEGKDEDIIALSDPPHYTACPNPYLKNFINEKSTSYNPENDEYERKPFVGDIKEGKSGSIYRAFSYHTKVPHKAIKKFINHYTNKGDLVLDGFCGVGFTGVAAQALNRVSILTELSTSAAFLSYNYNSKNDSSRVGIRAEKIIEEVEEECSWMYETKHSGDEKKNKNQKRFTNSEDRGRINYLVWSDVLICPYCNREYTYWDAAVKREESKAKKKYECPHCGAEIKSRDCDRVKEKYYDSALGKESSRPKLELVLINYTYGGQKYEKEPDKEDLELIREIQQKEIPYWFPTTELPDGYNTSQPIESHGYTHVHHYYTKRNLWVLSALWDKIEKDNPKIKSAFISFLDNHASRRNRWLIDKNHPSGTTGGPLSNTLYIPPLQSEVNVIEKFKKSISKVISLSKAQEKKLNEEYIVSSQSATELPIPKNSIDYIFVDPPFGSNIMYSELNFFKEAWLNVMTNNTSEAIINDVQNKVLRDYEQLMTSAFESFYSGLKPNRWMTVVFHNSRAAVWNAIQESIAKAGFIVAQVSVLDKKQGTLHQDSPSQTVKNDLVINAYKPKKKFEEKFIENAGKGMEVNFVKQQLKHLPVRNNVERTEKMLYSKLLSHYVENGFKIQYDSTDFYQLLQNNFTQLDGYWFLDSQVEDYNEWKSQLNLEEMKEEFSGQQVLFITDEKSALNWLHNFLHEPKKYSEIYTAYQQVATISKDEVPEVKELLENNFIQEEGKWRRPQTPEEKNKVQKDRKKDLDRAFKNIVKRAREGSTKIKNVRKEALIHGFTKWYQEEKYEEILEVADRLYKSTLESSGDIMDFVNIARSKTSGKTDKN